MRPGSTDTERYRPFAHVIETIEGYYNGMVTNPENRNIMDVIAECLIRVGLVPRDYTGERFEADMEAGTGPWADIGRECDPDPAFNRCWDDPQSVLQDNSQAGG